MAQPTSLRHECSSNLSILCSKGTGRGPSKCKYCGSRIRVEEGRYGVYVWDADARNYHRQSPVAVYASKARAEKVVNSAEGQQHNWVVRWLPA